MVTDPPYGLTGDFKIEEVLQAWLDGEKFEHSGTGFMGAEWDSFVPGPRVWREVLRVLKPGGHAVVFAGTRTVDLMGLAVRLGGFEVRDCGQWCYWSGFSKSLDLSKSMDQMRYDREQILQVTAWIAKARDDAGFSNADIDGQFGLNGMAGHWTSSKSQPAVPTIDQWVRLVEMLDAEVPPEIHALAYDLNGRKGEWGTERPDRELGGAGANRVLAPTVAVLDAGTPVTDNARKWAGWGTLVKPAIEPWLLLRKPLSESSIARNVLRWGTGGLNIDACRFAPGDPMWPGPQDDAPMTHSRNVDSEIYGDFGTQETHRTAGQEIGRLPANLIHVAKPSRKEKELGCEHLPARSGAEAVGREEGSAGLTPRAGAGGTAAEVRNHHPTVKPVKLMQWLVRLVTPPGGVVLDPFMGSGTTGVAAVSQGFSFLGMELQEDHLRICRARISHAAVGSPVDCDLEPEPVAPGQLDMWSQ